MATRRFRNGRWHYVIKRSERLPQPFYLSFDNEAVGDERVACIEAMLDRSIVPDELKEEPHRRAQVLREHARRYLTEQHVSISDRDYLRVALDGLPVALVLNTLTFAWATVYDQASRWCRGSLSGLACSAWQHPDEPAPVVAQGICDLALVFSTP